MYSNFVYMVPELAKLWRVSPDTIRRLINEKKLKATNIGQGKKRPRYRITADDARACWDNLANLEEVAPQSIIAPVEYEEFV